ncbi:MAG: heavy-metal-associated domain-containing protein [Methylovirgula sp.]
MQKYKVADMTCGKCVATITKTIQSLDPKADVACNLESKVIQVTTSVDAARIAAALADAGFESEPLAA